MKNKDGYFPASKVASGHFFMYKFPLERPIFWGPGQDTIFPATYVEPDKDRWRNNEILQIPKVARFIMGSGSPASGEGDPCAEPPAPAEYFVQLMDKRANLPPFPHDYVLVWDTFKNGVRQFTPQTYSILPFEVIFDGMAFVLFSNWDQFTVGMKFEGNLSFSIFKILYILNGFLGPGYYYGLIKLTPI